MDESFDHLARRKQPHAGFGRKRAFVRDSVQRLAHHGARKRRGRGVRLSRPHDDGRKAQRPAVDIALAREVAHEIFADHLLYAVGSLRRGRGRVVENFRKISSEGGDRAGENEARRVDALARLVEHRPHAAEVNAHAEVEIRFSGARDHRREMKDRSRVCGNRPLGELRVGDVAGERRKARVLGKAGGKGLVDEREARDSLRGERSSREQRLCQFRADKAPAAGDDDFHGVCVPRKIAAAATARSRGCRCTR